MLASPCLFLCFYLAPSIYGIPDPSLHSWTAVKVEPKSSHVGASEKCTSSRGLFLCYWVGLWFASPLEGWGSQGSGWHSYSMTVAVLPGYFNELRWIQRFDNGSPEPSLNRAQMLPMLDRKYTTSRPRLKKYHSTHKVSLTKGNPQRLGVGLDRCWDIYTHMIWM